MAGALPFPIKIVIPWYGNRTGGAEVFAAGLAKALTGIGRPVEVLTTCCRDPFHDWSANHLPAGPQQVDGVAVRRFAVRKRNAQRYAELSAALERDGGLAGPFEEELLRNSINSDDMTRHIADHAGDAVYLFLPYLYGTTIDGVKAAGRDNAMLIPCLHPESFAYLGPVRRMFSQIRGAMFLSEPERDFATTLYDMTGVAHDVTGGGVADATPGVAERFWQGMGATLPGAANGGRPDFALCVGRKVPGKGADLLVSHFADYCALRREDRDFHLVLIGSGELKIPKDRRGRIHSLTAESTEQVADAMAACQMLIQPSFMESFSLVLMEAWLHGRPALVNGACDVTRHHALESGGGLYFTNRAEFVEAVAMLRGDASLRTRLGEAGRRHVRGRYLWAGVAERVNEFLKFCEMS